MQNIFGDIRHRGKLYMIMRLKPDEEFIYKCITSQNLGLGRKEKIKIAHKKKSKKVTNQRYK